MTYKEQLRTPEWKRFALKMKDEHGWACRWCHRKQGEVELSIHHVYYIIGVKLWEHPPGLLECLCNDCHIERQELQIDLLVAVGTFLSRQPTKVLASRRAAYVALRDALTAAIAPAPTKKHKQLKLPI
jgi:hypothetical protein